MEIIILGSSGTIPTKERNLASVALIFEGEILLFDCGEGTQRQFLKYNLNISKISNVFISHLHLDHYLGLFGLLETINLINPKKIINIFGPSGTKKIFEKYKNTEIIEITKKKNILIEKKYQISTFKLNHGSYPCFAYIFQEKNRLKFYEKKAKAKGLKGPMFTEIQKKKKLKINGKIVHLSEISYEIKGKKIVYATDTLPSKSTIKNSEKADILIHDSTYSKELEDEAKTNNHTTTKQAANIAKTAKVKKLILFHISQRHKNYKILEDEAKKVFKETVCAKDGLIIKL